jgi:hypothetical protein
MVKYTSLTESLSWHRSPPPISMCRVILVHWNFHSGKVHSSSCSGFLIVSSSMGTFTISYRFVDLIDIVIEDSKRGSQLHILFIFLRWSLFLSCSTFSSTFTTGRSSSSRRKERAHMLKRNRGSTPTIFIKNVGNCEINFGSPRIKLYVYLTRGKCCQPEIHHIKVSIPKI